MTSDGKNDALSVAIGEDEDDEEEGWLAAMEDDEAALTLLSISA